jgi:hypothetical protein
VRLLAGSGELVDAGEVVFECGHLGLVELVLVGAVDGDEPQLVTESGGEAREVLASTFSSARWTTRVWIVQSSPPSASCSRGGPAP